MEWFPGRVFAFFRRAAKEGRSRRSEISLVLFPSRRSGQNPRLRHCEAGAHTGCGNPFSPSPPQRAILRACCGFAFCLCGSQLCPVSSGGLLSRRGESRQRHAKGNLSRRRFPLESFPIGQGAAAPLRSPGVYGGRKMGNERRGTKDGGRGTRDERRETKDGGRKKGDERRRTKEGRRRTGDEGRGCAMTGLGGGCVCSCSRRLFRTLPCHDMKNRDAGRRACIPEIIGVVYASFPMARRTPRKTWSWQNLCSWPPSPPSKTRG